MRTSASNQARNRPRWRCTKGHRPRRLTEPCPWRLRGSSRWSAAMRLAISALSPMRARLRRGVAQLGGQGVDAIGRQAQAQAQAVGVEGFGQALPRRAPRARRARARCRRSRRGCRVRASRTSGQARRGAQAFRRGAAVGAHQAAGTELHPAVPARDHDHDAIEALAVDRREDRPARGAGGFAVVAGAVFAADAVGPAVVRRVGVRATVGEEGERVGRRVDRRGLREEAAVLDLDARARRARRACRLIRSSARRSSGKGWPG